MVLYTGSGTVKVHNCGLGPHADMIFVKKITHKNLVEIYPLGYNDIAFRIVFQEIYTTAGPTGPAKYQLCPHAA